MTSWTSSGESWGCARSAAERMWVSAAEIEVFTAPSQSEPSTMADTSPRTCFAWTTLFTNDDTISPPHCAGSNNVIPIIPPCSAILFMDSSSRLRLPWHTEFSPVWDNSISGPEKIGWWSQGQKNWFENYYVNAKNIRFFPSSNICYFEK